MITYLPALRTATKKIKGTKFKPFLDVQLGKKKVGTIFREQREIFSTEDAQFTYVPAGQDVGGDFFKNIDDCKRSLES